MARTIQVAAVNNILEEYSEGGVFKGILKSSEVSSIKELVSGKRETDVIDVVILLEKLFVVGNKLQADNKFTEAFKKRGTFKVLLKLVGLCFGFSDDWKNATTENGFPLKHLHAAQMLGLLHREGLLSTESDAPDVIELLIDLTQSIESSPAFLGQTGEILGSLIDILANLSRARCYQQQIHINVLSSDLLNNFIDNIIIFIKKLGEVRAAPGTLQFTLDSFKQTLQDIIERVEPSSAEALSRVEAGPASSFPSKQVADISPQKHVRIKLLCETSQIQEMLSAIDLLGGLTLLSGIIEKLAQSTLLGNSGEKAGEQPLLVIAAHEVTRQAKTNRELVTPTQYTRACAIIGLENERLAVIQREEAFRNNLINGHGAELSKKDEQIAKLQRQLEEAQENARALENDKQQASNARNGFVRRTEEQAAEIKQQQTALEQQNQELVQRDKRVATLESKSEKQTQTINAYEECIAALNAQLKEKNQEISEVKSVLLNAEEEITKKEKDLTELTEQYDAAIVQVSSLENIQLTADALQKRLDGQTLSDKDKTKLQAEEEALLATIGSGTERDKKVRDTVTELIGRYKLAEPDIQALRTKIEWLQREKVSLTKAIEAGERAASDLRDEIIELKKGKTSSAEETLNRGSGADVSVTDVSSASGISIASDSTNATVNAAPPVETPDDFKRAENAPERSKEVLAEASSTALLKQLTTFVSVDSSGGVGNEAGSQGRLPNSTGGAANNPLDTTANSSDSIRGFATLAAYEKLQRMIELISFFDKLLPHKVSKSNFLSVCQLLSSSYYAEGKSMPQISGIRSGQKAFHSLGSYQSLLHESDAFKLLTDAAIFLLGSAKISDNAAGEDEKDIPNTMYSRINRLDQPGQALFSSSYQMFNGFSHAKQVMDSIRQYLETKSETQVVLPKSGGFFSKQQTKQAYSLIEFLEIHAGIQANPSEKSTVDGYKKMLRTFKASNSVSASNLVVVLSQVAEKLTSSDALRDDVKKGAIAIIEAHAGFVVTIMDYLYPLKVAYDRMDPKQRLVVHCVALEPVSSGATGLALTPALSLPDLRKLTAGFLSHLRNKVLAELKNLKLMNEKMNSRLRKDKNIIKVNHVLRAIVFQLKRKLADLDRATGENDGDLVNENEGNKAIIPSYLINLDLNGLVDVLQNLDEHDFAPSKVNTTIYEGSSYDQLQIHDMPESEQTVDLFQWSENKKEQLLVLSAQLNTDIAMLESHIRNTGSKVRRRLLAEIERNLAEILNEQSDNGIPEAFIIEIKAALSGISPSELPTENNSQPTAQVAVSEHTELSPDNLPLPVFAAHQLSESNQQAANLQSNDDSSWLPPPPPPLPEPDQQAGDMPSDPDLPPPPPPPPEPSQQVTNSYSVNDLPPPPELTQQVPTAPLPAPALSPNFLNGDGNGAVSSAQKGNNSPPSSNSHSNVHAQLLAGTVILKPVSKQDDSSKPTYVEGLGGAIMRRLDTINNATQGGFDHSDSHSGDSDTWDDTDDASSDKDENVSAKSVQREQNTLLTSIVNCEIEDNQVNVNDFSSAPPPPAQREPSPATSPGPSRP